MDTTTARALARLALILSAVIAGILNGSVLAAPVLIFMTYLLCLLVRQGQAAMNLYWSERTRTAFRRPADLRAENIPSDWGMPR